MSDPLGIEPGLLDEMRGLVEAARAALVRKQVTVIHGPKDKLPDWMREKKPDYWAHVVDHDLTGPVIAQYFDRWGNCIDSGQKGYSWIQGKEFVVVPILPDHYYPVTVVMVG